MIVFHANSDETVKHFGKLGHEGGLLKSVSLAILSVFGKKPFGVAFCHNQFFFVSKFK